MALITRTYTFTDGTTAYGSQVDSEVANIVNTLNNLNSASSSWSIVKTVNGSSVPLIADNSSGSNDVADFKVNGATKVSVDGTGNLQIVTATATTNLTGLTARFPQYRKPVLQYASGTVVNIETGLTGTSGQAVIVFPDGSVRTDSTTSRINCNLAQVAALTVTAQSGLRTGSIATNGWYYIYAVKSQVNSTDFVTVADTVLPVQASYATLNSNFGTNSWVPLGKVRVGDNNGNLSTVMRFVQAGNRTTLCNLPGGGVSEGLLLATAAGTTSNLTYTYSAGTGTTNIPATASLVTFKAERNTTSAATVSVFDVVAQAASQRLATLMSIQSKATGVIIPDHDPVDGIVVGVSGGTDTLTIWLTGWVDGTLGVGTTAL